MSHTTQPPIVFLCGKRIVLRPVAESDISYFLRWINDPEVGQFMNWIFPITEASEKKWYDSLDERKETDIVLTIMLNSNPIGIIGIHDINWKNRQATTGALLGEKTLWSQGYGTETKMILLDYIFNTLNLRKICSSVIGFNGRSKRYSEKCGYKVEAVLKDHIFAKGKYWDEIQLAVFRDEWLTLWEETKNDFLPETHV